MIKKSFNYDREGCKGRTSYTHHLGSSAVGQDAASEASGVEAVVNVMLCAVLLHDALRSREQRTHRRKAFGVCDALDASAANGVEEDVTRTSRLDDAHRCRRAFHTGREETEDDTKSTAQDTGDHGSDEAVVQ